MIKEERMKESPCRSQLDEKAGRSPLQPNLKAQSSGLCKGLAENNSLGKCISIWLIHDLICELNLTVVVILGEYYLMNNAIKLFGIIVALRVTTRV